MEYTTDDVADALREVIEASNAEKSARDGYEGGSWGYHGESLIRARVDAEERFQAALQGVIDGRIRAILKERDDERARNKAASGGV